LAELQLSSDESQINSTITHTSRGIMTLNTLKKKFISNGKLANMLCRIKT